jgi:phenylalanyl-tRNA synthetase beta chain
LTLKLSSEASARFEKGLNPGLAPMALKRATQLITQLGGGSVAKGMIDAYPGQVDRKPVPITQHDVKRLLGIDISLEGIKGCMEALGLDCKLESGAIQVERPWWRNDINCTADLVEEVARVTGYDNIPTSMLSSSLPSGESLPIVAFRQDLRNAMIAGGFQEIITYPLTNIETLKKLSSQSDLIGPEPLKIANPMSHELEYLRTSLRMGVLSVQAHNQRSRESNIRLFEIGKVYLPRKKDLPRENEILCALVDSIVPDIYWQSKRKAVDFYFVKGIVEALLARFGVQAELLPGEDPTMNLAKSADIMAGKVKLGIIGEVHPRVRENFDITDAAFIFELDVDKLLPLASKKLVYRAVSKYPGITRDVALIVDSDVTYDKIVDIIRGFNLVSEVSLFDLYAGEQIPSGKKSMAFRLIYLAADHTLKDEEVDAIQKHILKKLSGELGANLRS